MAINKTAITGFVTILQPDSKGEKQKSKLMSSTNILIIALVLILVSFADGCKPKLDSKDPKERAQAVKSITDSNLLATIAMEDKDEGVCMAATIRLTDLNVLEKVVFKNHYVEVRDAATEKLIKLLVTSETDQGKLISIATTHRLPAVCDAAVKRLTDQSVLAKMAVENNSRMAVRCLSDQKMLAWVASETRDWYVYSDAIGKLTDETARDNKKSEKIWFATLIDKICLSEDIDSLYRLAGRMEDGADSRLDMFIRIKLAIREPVIVQKLGKLRLIIGISEVSQSYSSPYSSGDGFTQGVGDEVTVSICFDTDRLLIRKTFKTNFPNEISVPVNHKSKDMSVGVGSADVDIKAILKDLLDASAFNQNDFLELAKSKIPEVRLVVTKKLVDQACLTKIALEDTWSEVRIVAVKELLDQALLAKIALEDKDIDISKAASEKLTDQSLLAKVATESKDGNVRSTVVKRITDQALLEKIVLRDKDSDVRKVVTENLINQVLLIKIAEEDKDYSVRKAAVSKLTDQTALTNQSLLIKIAKGDKDEFVRLNAVSRITDQAVLEKIATMDPSIYVRSDAICKLTDHKILDRVEAKNNDPIIHEVIMKRRMELDNSIPKK